MSNMPERPTGGVPKVVNFTGCSGVHLGNVVNVGGVRPPRRQPADASLPTKQHVDILLKCSREVGPQDELVAGEHLGSAWKALGRAVGLSPGQLDNIAADNTRSADRAHEVLTRWHDREADDATVAVLTQLLIKVKAYHVLKHLSP